jgi:2-polyprenyl-3-methyl-5-hydroxy-6-metoxy-1,4-benzoquinol methylase
MGDWLDNLPREGKIPVIGRLVSWLRRLLRRPWTNEALFQRQTRQWNRLAQKAPYWSVLRGCAKTRTVSEIDIREFYQSGANEVKTMQDCFRYAGCALPSGVCVDWGCGLGRVTIHLANHFQCVVGVDISAAHLETARQYVDSLDQETRDRITLYDLAHDQAELVDLYGQVDLVHSILTLQHMPPPLMIETLTTFARLLKGEGFAFFQIPTHGEKYDYQKFNHYQTSAIEMHALAQRKVHAIFRAHGCDAIATFENNRAGSGFLSHYFIFQKR